MSARYGLQVRAAHAADADGMAELFAAAGHPVAASILAARLEALPRRDAVALLALEWGPPSGLVSAHWFRGLSSDLPIAEIDLLLVGPDARRRGIGRVLLKAVAQAARAAGCDTLRLAIPDNGADLRAFCDANGFTPAGGTATRPLRKKG